MNPKLKRIAAWAGYPLFYAACLILFCYVSAPWDRVKTAVTTSFNNTSPLRMEIDKLTWAWRFPGISATGVRFVGGPAATGTATTDAPSAEKPPLYVVDSLFARVSVLPLLWGTTKLGFTLDGFGGSIDGTVRNASDSRDIAVDLSDVDAGKLPYLPDLLGIPIAGSLTGKIDLKIPQGKLSLAEGTIEFKIKDFVVGDGKAKIHDTIVLPKVNAGDFVFKADVTEGTLKVTELSTKGTDLEVVSDGRIRLAETVNGSIADINLRFKFADAYKNKDEMTRSIFGAPGSSVPGLFDLDPKMKRAKREDGFYAWHIMGALARLSFQPAVGGGTDTAARGRRAPLRGFTRPKGADEAPAVSPPVGLPPLAPAGADDTPPP